MRPILFVSREYAVAQETVWRLRQLGEIAVWLDEYDAAVEMMQVVDVGLVVVDVSRSSDWILCRRLTHQTRCPVGVLTDLLAPDRRFRDRAFRMGIAAYVAKPATWSRVRALLRRIRRGDTGIELVEGAAYSQI